jgi:hypothetical protein
MQSGKGQDEQNVSALNIVRVSGKYRLKEQIEIGFFGPLN